MRRAVKPLPNKAEATISRHIRASDRNGRFAFRAILTLLSVYKDYNLLRDC